MSSGKSRLTTEPERVNPVVPMHVWRSPAGASADVLIIAHLSVYTDMYEHATAAMPNETGGFLLGRVGHDARSGAWIVEVNEAVAVEPIQQNPVHFSFGWRDVDRVRTRREAEGNALVGWYHTHPGMGIFLSDTDLEKTHRVLFSEPFQIALVYDPVRGRAGYFFWDSERTIDVSVAPWREFEIVIADEPGPDLMTGGDTAPVEIVGNLPSGPGRPADGSESVTTPLEARFHQAAADGTPSIPSRSTAEEIAVEPAPQIAPVVPEAGKISDGRRKRWFGLFTALVLGVAAGFV